MLGNSEGWRLNRFEAFRQADDSSGKGGYFLRPDGKGKCKAEVGLNLWGKAAQFGTTLDFKHGPLKRFQYLVPLRIPESACVRVGRTVSLA